jgi:hypothetical protein
MIGVLQKLLVILIGIAHSFPLLGAANADVLTGEPQTFDPITGFMYEEIGTIIASEDQIVFAGGAELQLIFVEENSVGEWPVIPTGVTAPAKIYKVVGGTPKLKGGRSICGDDVPVTHVAVWADVDPLVSRRPEARFNFYSSDTAPNTDKSEGWCLTLITYAGTSYKWPTYDGAVWTDPLSSTTEVPTKTEAGRDEVAAGSEPGVHYHESYDDFTESNTSIVVLVPRNGEMFLVWGCGGLFDFSSTLIQGRLVGDSDGNVSIQYKFDGGEVSEPLVLSLGATRMGINFAVGTNSLFLEQALSSREAMIRITDLHDYSEKTASFPLNGLGDELKKLECY